MIKKLSSPPSPGIGMNDILPRLYLRAEGSLACFSRPEFSVERASYPWITPSAARAIFEAVLWKPRICWEIRQIRVLKPIRWLAIKRNEIGARVPMRGLEADTRLLTDQERQQRNTLALRDVAYVIAADLHLRHEVPRDGEHDNHAKYRDMFQRRLDKGQVFHRPYLGCREFAADVSPATGDELAIGDTLDHGPMVYDFRFPVKYDAVEKGSHRWRDGKAEPLLFDAKLVNGVVEVPTFAEVEMRQGAVP